MKFSDEAWELYKKECGVTDDQRAALEGYMAEEQAKYAAQAPGDTELMLGLMTLDLMRDMARDFCMSEEQMLGLLVGKSPKPAVMRRAVKRARAHRRGQGGE